jgi:hypothetical protein
MPLCSTVWLGLPSICRLLALDAGEEGTFEHCENVVLKTMSMMIDRLDKFQLKLSPSVDSVLELLQWWGKHRMFRLKLLNHGWRRRVPFLGRSACLFGLQRCLGQPQFASMIEDSYIRKSSGES